MIGGVFPKVIRVVLGVATVLWLALVAQAVHGLGWDKTERLKPRTVKRSDNGHYWTCALPKTLRSRSLTDARGVFLEDGRPLWREMNRYSRESGDHGWYRIHGSTVTFSLSDGSDPRATKRKMEARAPRPVPWWVVASSLLALAAGHVVAVRRFGVEPPFSGFLRWSGGWAGAGWWPWALFGGALAVRGALAWDWRTANDGFMTVKGLPYSDAMGWLETARHLALGHGMAGGFEGQRPLYATILAFLMMLGGLKVVWGPLVSVVWGAVAAALGGWLSGRVAGTWAGVASMLFLAGAGRQAAWLPAAMTEGPSLAYVLAAVFCWWRGAVEKKWLWLAAGGVFTGLANLTCTFTLLAWPLMGMVAALRWGRDERGALALRRWFVRSAAVAAGGLLVLLPWVVRNKVRFDVLTFSTQSSALLYSTVSAQHRLTPQIVAEADAAGVPQSTAERYIYFKQRFVDTVKADPAAYVRQLGEGLSTFLRALEPDDPHGRLVWMLTPALLLLGGASAGRPRTWLAVAATVFAGWALGTTDGRLAFPLVSAGALATRCTRCRVLAALLVAHVAGVTAMNAMVGGELTRRLWSSADWAVVMLGLLALVNLGRAVAGEAAPPQEAEAPRSLRAATWLTLGLGLVTAIICAVVIGRTVAGPKEATSIPLDALAAQAKARLGEAASAGTVVDAVELDLFATFIDRGENLHHWSRAFALRDAARTVAYMRPPGGDELFCVQLPGNMTELPRHRPFLLVSRLNEDPQATLRHDTVMREAVALHELEREGDGWRLGRDVLARDGAAK